MSEILGENGKSKLVQNNGGTERIALPEQIPLRQELRGILDRFQLGKGNTGNPFFREEAWYYLARTLSYSNNLDILNTVIDLLKNEVPELGLSTKLVKKLENTEKSNIEKKLLVIIEELIPERIFSKFRFRPIGSQTRVQEQLLQPLISSDDILGLKDDILFAEKVVEYEKKYITKLAKIREKVVTTPDITKKVRADIETYLKKFEAFNTITWYVYLDLLTLGGDFKLLSEAFNWLVAQVGLSENFGDNRPLQRTKSKRLEREIGQLITTQNTIFSENISYLPNFTSLSKQKRKLLEPVLKELFNNRNGRLFIELLKAQLQDVRDITEFKTKINNLNEFGKSTFKAEEGATPGDVKIIETSSPSPDLPQIMQDSLIREGSDGRSLNRKAFMDSLENGPVKLLKELTEKLQKELLNVSEEKKFATAADLRLINLTLEFASYFTKVEQLEQFVNIVNKNNDRFDLTELRLAIEKSLGIENKYIDFVSRLTSFFDLKLLSKNLFETLCKLLINANSIQLRDEIFKSILTLTQTGGIIPVIQERVQNLVEKYSNRSLEVQTELQSLRKQIIDSLNYDEISVLVASFVINTTSVKNLELYKQTLLNLSTDKDQRLEFLKNVLDTITGSATSLSFVTRYNRLFNKTYLDYSFENGRREILAGLIMDTTDKETLSKIVDFVYFFGKDNTFSSNDILIVSERIDSYVRKLKEGLILEEKTVTKEISENSITDQIQTKKDKLLDFQSSVLSSIPNEPRSQLGKVLQVIYASKKLSLYDDALSILALNVGNLNKILQLTNLVKSFFSDANSQDIDLFFSIFKPEYISRDTLERLLEIIVDENSNEFNLEVVDEIRYLTIVTSDKEPRNLAFQRIIKTYEILNLSEEERVALLKSDITNLEFAPQKMTESLVTRYTYYREFALQFNSSKDLLQLREALLPPYSQVETKFEIVIRDFFAVSRDTMSAFFTTILLLRKIDLELFTMISNILVREENVSLFEELNDINLESDSDDQYTEALKRFISRFESITVTSTFELPKPPEVIFVPSMQDSVESKEITKIKANLADYVKVFIEKNNSSVSNDLQNILQLITASTKLEPYLEAQKIIDNSKTYDEVYFAFLNYISKLFFDEVESIANFANKFLRLFDKDYIDFLVLDRLLPIIIDNPRSKFNTKIFALIEEIKEIDTKSIPNRNDLFSILIEEFYPSEKNNPLAENVRSEILSYIKSNDARTNLAENVISFVNFYVYSNSAEKLEELLTILKKDKNYSYELSQFISQSKLLLFNEILISFTKNLNYRIRGLFQPLVAKIVDSSSLTERQTLLALLESLISRVLKKEFKEDALITKAVLQSLEQLEINPQPYIRERSILARLRSKLLELPEFKALYKIIQGDIRLKLEFQTLIKSLSLEFSKQQLRMNEEGKTIDFSSRALFAALINNPQTRELLQESMEKLCMERSQKLEQFIVEQGNTLFVPTLIIGGGWHSAVISTELSKNHPGLNFLTVDRNLYPGGQFYHNGESYVTNSANRPESDVLQPFPGQGGNLNTLGPNSAVQIPDFTNDYFVTNNDFGVGAMINQTLYGLLLGGYEFIDAEKHTGVDGTYRANFKQTITGKEISIITDLIIVTTGEGEEKLNLDLSDKETREIVDEELKKAKKGEPAQIYTSDLLRASFGDSSNLTPFQEFSGKTIAIAGSGDSAKTLIEDMFGLGVNSRLSVATTSRPKRVEVFGAVATYRDQIYRNFIERPRYSAIEGLVERDGSGETTYPVIGSIPKLERISRSRNSPGKLIITDSAGRRKLFDSVVLATGFSKNITQKFSRITKDPLDVVETYEVRGLIEGLGTNLPIAKLLDENGNAGVLFVGPAADIQLSEKDFIDNPKLKVIQQIPANSSALWLKTPSEVTLVKTFKPTFERWVGKGVNLREVVEKSVENTNSNPLSVADKKILTVTKQVLENTTLPLVELQRYLKYLVLVEVEKQKCDIPQYITIAIRLSSEQSTEEGQVNFECIVFDNNPFANIVLSNSKILALMQKIAYITRREVAINTYYPTDVVHDFTSTYTGKQITVINSISPLNIQVIGV
jgi:hypothetical protein